MRFSLSRSLPGISVHDEGRAEITRTLAPLVCALTIACWARPYPGTPPSHVMPWYVFWPIISIVFFNGQYYAQRVIGNYYIRKAQDYAKRGIVKVDLHAS